MVSPNVSLTWWSSSASFPKLGLSLRFPPTPSHLAFYDLKETVFGKYESLESIVPINIWYVSQIWGSWGTALSSEIQVSVSIQGVLLRPNRHQMIRFKRYLLLPTPPALASPKHLAIDPIISQEEYNRSQNSFLLVHSLQADRKLRVCINSPFLIPIFLPCNIIPSFL